MMAINLFWTGGWDSTYRLHQLVFDLEEQVQPIYVVDETRRSVRHELRAVGAIKQAIREKDAAAGARVLPTRIAARGDLPKNREITEAHRRLKVAIGLGEQYEWLARYAAQCGCEPIEMAVEQYSRLHEPLLECAELDERGRYMVQPKLGHEDMYTVFRYYRFPVLDVSKSKIREEVQRKGWADVQNMSWFCHMPRANDTPCGGCSACRQVLKGGMGYRIPQPQRLKGRLLLLTVHSPLGRQAKMALKRSVATLKRR